MRPILVVPVYNEASTLGAVVVAARAHLTVIVVDDGSTDGSADIARSAGAEVIRHARRLGKGQALRTGIAAARARCATHALTLDGDGQHDPADLPVLLAMVRTRPRALVIGRRTGGAGGMSRGRANALRVAGFFASWAGGVQVEDTQSGFRAYPLALFGEVHPGEGGFVFETEVLLEAIAGGWEVVEVDVVALPRGTQRSRLRPFVDGGAIGLYLARRVGRRWAREVGAALRETTAFARRDARRARHATILADASPYADTPARWALAIGAGTVHRISTCLAGWRRHPRLRRAGVVATATVAAPLLGAAALLETLFPGDTVNVVTPLVDRLYSQRRLDAATHPRARTVFTGAPPAAVSADALAVSPPPEA